MYIYIVKDIIIEIWADGQIYSMNISTIIVISQYNNTFSWKWRLSTLYWVKFHKRECGQHIKFIHYYCIQSSLVIQRERQLQENKKIVFQTYSFKFTRWYLKSDKVLKRWVWVVKNFYWTCIFNLNLLILFLI